MNTQHTPGPWHVGMRSGHNGNIVYAYDAYDGDHAYDATAICSMYDMWVNRRVDEQKDNAGLANARLIAAAPDLLAALQALVDQPVTYHTHRIEIECKSHSDAMERVKQARKVIAQALGHEPQA